MRRSSSAREICVRAGPVNSSSRIGRSVVRGDRPAHGLRAERVRTGESVDANGNFVAAHTSKPIVVVQTN